jgi:hypothetical protein
MRQVFIMLFVCAILSETTGWAQAGGLHHYEWFDAGLGQSPHHVLIHPGEANGSKNARLRQDR